MKPAGRSPAAVLVVALALGLAPAGARGDDAEPTPGADSGGEEGVARVALAEAEAALRANPDDALLQRAWARSVRAVARALQRRDGYGTAIDFLEPRLRHPLVAEAYTETCLWGGQEERAIRRLRTVEGIDPRLGARHEVWLLVHLGRYDAAVARAREAGWEDLLRYAENLRDERARLRGRARRAWVVTGVALALLLAGALLFARWLRRPPAA